MKQKTLSNWLKCIIAGVVVCGLVVYAVIVPSYGVGLRSQYPELSHCFWPWLLFIWMTAIPCFTVLVFGWKVAASIGMDRSFSQANADRFKWISVLAAGDSAFFFAGNVIFLFLNMNHPGIMLMSLLVVFAGIAVSVAAAALSHLVHKAAELQEQSDLTI